MVSIDIHPAVLNVTVITPAGPELFHRSGSKWVNHVKPGSPVVSEDEFKAILGAYADHGCMIIPFSPGVPQQKDRMVNIPDAAERIELSEFSTYSKSGSWKMRLETKRIAYVKVSTGWQWIGVGLMGIRPYIFSHNYVHNLINGKRAAGWEVYFFDKEGKEIT